MVATATNRGFREQDDIGNVQKFSATQKLPKWDLIQ